MGYELHVSRKDIFDDSEEDNISLDEWLRYVDSDPEIERDPKDDELEQFEYFVYIAHTQRWPIWYHSELGYLYTKNPDGETIGKLVEIADALNARVQGDEGEYYEDDSGYPVGYVPPEPCVALTKPWWKFW